MRVTDNLPNKTLPGLNTLGIVPAEDELLYVVGFGQVNDNTLSDTLQGLTYNFINACEERFEGYNPTVHLCADATPFQGACYGDGGSPAVLNRNKSLIVGLSSFSDGLCDSQTFNVYTRISLYEQWIKEQICTISKFKPKSCTSCNAAFTVSQTITRFGRSVASFLGF
jgi:secreted trypsin-like serine protease